MSEPLKFFPPFTVTTKRELNFGVKQPKEGVVPLTIPAGMRIEVAFAEGNDQFVYVLGQNSLRNLRLSITRAKGAITGFSARPSERTLEKWLFDDVVKTPTGHRVEPDGHGPDGSPSWLRVLGLI